MEEIVAYGHLARGEKDYNGIVFDQDGNRILRVRGKNIATGILPGPISPKEYFTSLAFLQDFPDIKYWAFGQAWTGRVKITFPGPAGGDVLAGSIFFNREEASQMRYYYIETDYSRHVPVILVPDVPNWSSPLNIPLRLLIALLILDVKYKRIPANTWYATTSVVKTDEVYLAIPENVIDQFGFRLHGYSNNIRSEFVALMGLL